MGGIFLERKCRWDLESHNEIKSEILSHLQCLPKDSESCLHRQEYHFINQKVVSGQTPVVFTSATVVYLKIQGGFSQSCGEINRIRNAFMQ